MSMQVITKLILMTTIIVALETIIALGSLEKNCFYTFALDGIITMALQHLECPPI
jgi:hypothetical protein